MIQGKGNHRTCEHKTTAPEEVEIFEQDSATLPEIYLVRSIVHVFIFSIIYFPPASYPPFAAPPGDVFSRADTQKKAEKEREEKESQGQTSNRRLVRLPTSSFK